MGSPSHVDPPERGTLRPSLAGGVQGVLWRDLAHPPLEIEQGDGVYLYDTEGKRYLDAASGAAVCALGHGNPEIAAELRDQAETIAYVHLSLYSSRPLQRWADALLDTAPKNLTRVYPVSGGSEANETAIKLARQYHLQRGRSGKYKVISRRVSYHGATLGVLSLTGQTARRRAFAPMMVHQPRAAPAYCYRCPFDKTPDACSLECADDLERVIVQEGPENVSAFIAEPVSGASAPGVYPPDSYWERIREICDRYDVLLIADEVMSGMGRTGVWWAIQHSGVRPDMITAAKGLGAGYTPIGAVMVSEEVIDVLTRTRAQFAHGLTYGGNPLSCAVGAKVIEILTREGLVERASAQGLKLLGRLQEALGDHPHVGEVRGRGLLLGVEIVADRGSKRAFPLEADIRGKIGRSCLEQGLYVYPGGGSVDGLRGDHVLIAPPFTIEDAHIEELVDRLCRAVDAVFAEEAR